MSQPEVVQGLGSQMLDVSRAVVRLANKALAGLLCLPAEVFAARVHCTQNLDSFLESFLRNRSRASDAIISRIHSKDIVLDETGDAAWGKKQKRAGLAKLDRRVLSIYHRIATETNKGGMSESKAKTARGVREFDSSRIFDIPKLFDLCAIYGETHESALFEIFQNFFESHPAYYGDLAGSFPAITTALQNVLGKIQSCVRDIGTTGADPLWDCFRFAVDILSSLYNLARISQHVFISALRNPLILLTLLATFLQQAREISGLVARQGLGPKFCKVADICANLSLRLMLDILSMCLDADGERAASDFQDIMSRNDMADSHTILEGAMSFLERVCREDFYKETRALLQVHGNVSGRLQECAERGLLDTIFISEMMEIFAEEAPIPAHLLDAEKGEGKSSSSEKRLPIKSLQIGKAVPMNRKSAFAPSDSPLSSVDLQLRAQMLAIISAHDSDDDEDDTLDDIGILRMRSDGSTFSDDDLANEAPIELLDVVEINGLATGIVRDEEGKKREVLMPNSNHKVAVDKSRSNSRRRKKKSPAAAQTSSTKPSSAQQSRSGGGRPVPGKKSAASKSRRGPRPGKTQRERQKNERKKSSRANHNRKSRALKKSAKGM